MGNAHYQYCLETYQEEYNRCFIELKLRLNGRMASKNVLPECGANAQVINDEDYIDDFFNKAEMFNTRLQLISPDSEEGDMLLKAFGGVAALLRYKM